MDISYLRTADDELQIVVPLQIALHRPRLHLDSRCESECSI